MNSATDAPNDTAAPAKAAAELDRVGDLLTWLCIGGGTILLAVCMIGPACGIR